MRQTLGQLARVVLGSPDLEPDLRDYYRAQRSTNRRPIPITVVTKVPSKWRFVDLETNQVWAWDTHKHQFVLSEDLKLKTGSE